MDLLAVHGSPFVSVRRIYDIQTVNRTAPGESFTKKEVRADTLGHVTSMPVGVLQKTGRLSVTTPSPIEYYYLCMKTESPNIFQYVDFRKYLAEYYAYRKAEEPRFTHTYICHRLGQGKARSYFNNVLSGRTTVTPTFVGRFVGLPNCLPMRPGTFGRW
jgi:hypothetical protein